MNVVLKLAVAYLEKHPEVVEQLIEQLVQAIINAIKAHNAAPPQA